MSARAGRRIVTEGQAFLVACLLTSLAWGAAPSTEKIPETDVRRASGETSTVNLDLPVPDSESAAPSPQPRGGRSEFEIQTAGSGGTNDPLITCPATAIVGDGSTSGNGRAPIARFRGVRAVYLIRASELAAAGLTAGATPSAIGWRYSTAPGIVATGTLTVYLQNTNDATNTKSTSFAAATAGMTVVHNAATTLPNTTAAFDVTFAGGSAFTYTGGGLYVAFDWRYPTGGLSSTAVIACNTALTGGLLSSQTSGAGAPPAPDGMSASNFRPETRLTVNVANDVSVDYVITMGQVPDGLAPAQVVRAVVTNKGAAVANVPVTLSVSGAQSFTDTQTIAALAACNGQTTVSFAPFTPSVLGSDTVTVSLPPDDVPANNSKSRPLDDTVNRYSYKHPGTTPTGGVGVTNGTAEFLARFSLTAPSQIDAVTIEFPAAIPAATYRVSIREDDGGMPGNQLYVDAVNRNVSAAGSFTFRLPTPVPAGPGDVYVGVQQTSTTNMGLSFDQEVPIRSGAFYLSVGGGAFADFSPGNNFKLNVGITIGACLVPLANDVAPDATGKCAGNPLVFTSSVSGGTGAYTYQWTEDGVDVSGQTGPSISVTKVLPGAHLYNAKVTDDGGCANVTDPASAIGTWIADGGSCDDGNPCTSLDACTGSTCVGNVPTDCDDGDACTADTCNTGTGLCEHVTIGCGDGNPCTDDACDPQSGCVFTNNALACSDGSACTLGDICGGGSCHPGAPVVCDDANPCTDDACNPATGDCVATNNVAPCSDGNACTGGDVCGGGTCHPGVPVGCDDGNPCTDDSCDPQLGCVHVNNAASCDDGNACTTGDACVAGACQPGAATVCDDGNVCTDDTCAPASGCVFTNNAAACTDGNACTTGDVCGDGSCHPGAPTVCNDGNACTDDACNPATGLCEATDNAASCDDGDACTTGDVCSGGTCHPGGPTSCDDGNVCTDDSCVPATGCAHTANTAVCDDGSACTNGDVCGGGTCQPGAPTVCDDGNVCTDDSCNPATGACEVTNNVNPCDDGNACTTNDVCGGGACHGGAPLGCSDGNPCTDDACDPQSGCVHVDNAAPCEDGNACTTGDVCAGGACQPGGPTVCDDGNVCTLDTCDPQTGCVHAPSTATCDDGNACTTGDSCAARLEEAFDGVSAPALPGGWTTTLLIGQPTDLPWTTVATSPDSPPNSAFADDPDHITDKALDSPPIPVTSASATVTFRNRYNLEAGFDGGVLEISIDGGAFTDILVAGGSFTSGGYDTTIGLFWGSPIAGRPAWTGQSAGYPDYVTTTAQLPASVAGHTVVLRWRVASDASVSEVGQDVDTIAFVEPTATCTGTVTNCDDGNPCTDDSCDPQTGACVHVDNTDPCDDGNACTTGDVCSGGACQPGGPTSCDDANVCTDDSCVPATGCAHVPNTLVCDDGNACTNGDVCGGGSCQAGTPTVCNDGNPCTDDSCNPATGACETTNNAAACDDGNACTTGDVCAGGSCQPGVPAIPPPVIGLAASPDKSTFTWMAAPLASQYDVVRGLTSALPVGPGGDDEVCFPDLASAAVVDATVPSPGSAFWYQVRGEGACGVGGYGTQSNGTPRLTSTCP